MDGVCKYEPHVIVYDFGTRYVAYFYHRPHIHEHKSMKTTWSLLSGRVPQQSFMIPINVVTYLGFFYKEVCALVNRSVRHISSTEWSSSTMDSRCSCDTTNIVYQVKSPVPVLQNKWRCLNKFVFVILQWAMGISRFSVMQPLQLVEYYRYYHQSLAAQQVGQAALSQRQDDFDPCMSLYNC